MSEIFLKVKLLNPKAKLPTRANPTDVGLDVYSTETVTLEPRQVYLPPDDEDNIGTTETDPTRAIISTGISVEFPPGYGLFVWDRSGLSANKGLHRVAGVIDCTFRGEIKIALINLSNKSYTIKEGDKIAQLVLAPIVTPTIIQVENLSNTDRGTGGFGSTGK